LLGASASLPSTGTAENVRDVALGVAGIAGVAAISQAGLGLYRRRALGL
jgi:hypothetical protein